MTQFWIAALALGLVAAAFVLVPVLRAWKAEGQGPERSSNAYAVSVVIALAIPVLSLMMYSHWTIWDWGTGSARTEASADMHEMDEVLSALEQRLAENPEDLESWLLLGRSYMSMQRFQAAAGAYRQAVALDATNSPQVLADYGEALALSDPSGLQGEAGAIFERVLALSPAHPKGLWYGGINAFDNANWALADERLSLLLTLDPPETLVPLIQERLETARAQAAGTPSTGMPPSMPTASAAPAPDAADAADPGPSSPAAEDAEPAPEVLAAVESKPEERDDAGTAGDDDGVIDLEISLDPSLAERVSNGTPVFIIARNPAGGPPLAVIRATASELPMAVGLGDANAMMEGVTISDQAELELIARVSLSGSPAQRPGDLYGAVNYTRGSSGPTRIRIDRVAE